MSEKLSYTEMSLVVEATFDSSKLKELERTRPDLCIYTLDTNYVEGCLKLIAEHNQDEGILFDEL